MRNPDPRARLVELAARQGTSLAALSAYIGRNSAYLQQFVRKGSPRKLEEGDRRRLARFLGVDDSELGGGEEISSSLVTRGDWVDVPRLALGASAGPGAVGSALGGAEQTIGAFHFSAAGDSMEPTLRDGDEILVDRSPRPWRDGVHVVRCGDAVMVKRVDLSQPGRVLLRSDNHAYPPLELAPGEVERVGRVVWKSGRL